MAFQSIENLGFFELFNLQNNFTPKGTQIFAPKINENKVIHKKTNSTRADFGNRRIEDNESKCRYGRKVIQSIIWIKDKNR